MEATMLKLGLSHNWVNLIMRCITSTFFSVIINRVPKELITPQRGLRQGYPLSSYLFIMCAKVFSSLLLQVEEPNIIHGLKFRSTTTISHLLFADDSLIFMRVDVAECKHLKNIFDCYTRASGQLFNLDNSSSFLVETLKWRM